MAKGWISLHRQIWDSWVWKEKPFSKGQAWVDLLLMANHEDKKTLIGNDLILVKRGSHITSQLKLMERWGWGKEKVRNFLKLLESDDMISVTTTSRYTLITVTNYETYQNQTSANIEVSSNTEECQTANRLQTDREQTADRPQTDRRPTTNNNDNNYNNYNNTTSTTREADPALRFMDEISAYYSQLTGRVPSPKDEVAITQIAKITQDYEFVKDIMKDIADRYKPMREGDTIKTFTYFVPGIQDRLYAEKEKKEVKPIEHLGREVERAPKFDRSKFFYNGG